jgi:hypothetical protein
LLFIKKLSILDEYSVDLEGRLFRRRLFFLLGKRFAADDDSRPDDGQIDPLFPGKDRREWDADACSLEGYNIFPVDGEVLEAFYIETRWEEREREIGKFDLSL